MTRSVLGALAASVVAMSALAAAGPAQAADPCPTGQATYLSTGAEQCYTVPPGVSTVHVVAVGGSGGVAEADATIHGVGGAGAQVTADLAVTGGQTLYVEVGGNGADGDAATEPGAGGFNGGGTSAGWMGSSSGAGGGGGASDVRTQSCAGGCPGDATSLGSRLLVAAGGGGGGLDWVDNETDASLAGGAGGTPAPGGDGGAGALEPCGGGRGATQSAGGDGGDFSCAPGGTPGLEGSLGIGGSTTFGGGGGAGLYGGGAGTAGEGPQTGGGGGSSFGPSGVAYALDTTRTPRVIISAPPMATSGAAGAVTPTTATLHGTVNPDGQPTTYRFEYGASTTYGSTTPAGTVAADSTEHAVSADLSGLRPLTTYHFRLVATNAAGTSVGPDHVFTTTAPPPGPQPPSSDRTVTTPPQPPSPTPPQPQPHRKPKPRQAPKRHRHTSRAAADLALRMLARPHRVRVGEQISYTLRVTNRGRQRAIHVVVSDNLPRRLRLVSKRASAKGHCSGRRRVTCRFGHLARGRHVTVRIVVRAVRTGRARDTAHVSAHQHDAHRADNHASATVSIVREPRFTG